MDAETSKEQGNILIELRELRAEIARLRVDNERLHVELDAQRAEIERLLLENGKLRRVEQAAIALLDVTSVGDQYFVACLNGEESQEIRLALVKLAEAIRDEEDE